MNIGNLQQEGNGLVHYEIVDKHTKACFEIDEDKLNDEKNTITNLKYANNLYVSYLKNKLNLTLLSLVYDKSKPNINNTTLNKMIATLEQNSVQSIKAWLDEKISKSTDKKESKLKNQKNKFMYLNQLIIEIEDLCNKEFGESQLTTLLKGNEKDVYLKQLVKTMIRHYLVNHKRGDE